MKPQELHDKKLQRIGREDREVCWTVRILTAVQRRPGGRSWKQSSRRKMCMEWREWDVHSADHAHQVVRGRLWFWHTRLFYVRVGFYLVHSKCVICVSLYVLIGHTLIIWLTIILMVTFTFLWIGQCPLSVIVFPSADMEDFGHWEHIFCFYLRRYGCRRRASVIGWLANVGLGNVWKEVFMA
jgi:hypothetical protein